jgi:hypothetical protein
MRFVAFSRHRCLSGATERSSVMHHRRASGSAETPDHQAGRPDLPHEGRERDTGEQECEREDDIDHTHERTPNERDLNARKMTVRELTGISTAAAGRLHVQGSQQFGEGRGRDFSTRTERGFLDGAQAGRGHDV